MFPEEMAGQTIQCPHCQMDTLLYIPPVEATRKSRSGVALLFVTLIGIVLFLCIGYILFKVVATKNVEASKETIDSSERGVKGALGWTLGDVLPNTDQVKTNDDIYGITYDFQQPEELAGDDISSCFLVLTDDRRIAEICVEGKENNNFSLQNFQKVFKEKYGAGVILKDGTISTYFFGQGERQIMLRTIQPDNMPLIITLIYQDRRLSELAEKQKADRKALVNSQIQNNLKGKF